MPSVRVDFDVPARMRDGVTLRANVYRPDDDARHPVLLSRTPYGKDFPNAALPLDAPQAARRGYVVIVQDTRGRFASEGEWKLGTDEARDGADSVAWAAALPYADGTVGMFGGSYVGFTQWSAALEAPPALRAIAPTLTWREPLDGVAFRGGAFELGLLANWLLLFAVSDVPRHPAADPMAQATALARLAHDIDGLAAEGYQSLPLREFAPLARHRLLGHLAGAFVAPGERVARSDFMRIAGKDERLAVPAFVATGWYDVFLHGALENFAALRRRGVPARLVVGPWSHQQHAVRVGERAFGFASQAAFIDLRADLGSMQLRWFDRYLSGRENGIDREPPVSIFVMGANAWRHEAEWPLARAVETSFYLRAGGRLDPAAPADEAPDEYEYDPRDPVPTLGGALLMPPEYLPGPADQRPIEGRADVLSYTSEPLARDLEVTGPVRAHLFVASSAPHTDFVARLVDVEPGGYARNLTDAIVRARYRDPERPAPLEPGRPVELVLDLWATSNLFRAGHRIRVDVTSSSFPRWDRNPNTGHAFGADDELRAARQTVLHDAGHPSHVVLPVVPT